MVNYIYFIGVTGLLLAISLFGFRRISRGGLLFKLGAITGLIAAITAVAWYIIGTLALPLLWDLIAMAVVIPVALTTIYLIFRRIIEPIRQLNQAIRRINTGDISVALRVDGWDEIQEMQLSFNQWIEHLTGVVEKLHQVSTGDLTQRIEILSNEDRLGNSIMALLERYKSSIKNVAEQSTALASTSELLAQNAALAAQLTSQIAQTTQEAAGGSTQQADSVNSTAVSIDQLVRSIQGVASGAQEQAGAANRAAEMTSALQQSITQVAQNTSQVLNDSTDAADLSKDGYQTVQSTLSNMKSIEQAMGASQKKVVEMGTRSEQIGAIVTTIEDIASQTNLLALNAAIEAAHAETQAQALTEFLLNQQMVAQAHLIAEFLVVNGDQQTQAFWTELGRTSNLDTILATDDDGVVTVCNDPGLLGFRFSDDPKAQTFEFRKLITQKGGVVCQPPQKRAADDQLFKYIGISRRDKPGVVQIGFNSTSLQRFKLQVGGFAVVANEVYRLAENAKSSAKEIGTQIKQIQLAVKDAVSSMILSTEEVRKGTNKAEDAARSLESIQQAVLQVSKQAELANNAAVTMEKYSNELVTAIDSVSAIIEENTAATEQMTASSSQVSSSIENIASISEENSAAIEEVSASAQQMSSQVAEVTTTARELADMASGLKTIVSQYQY